MELLLWSREKKYVIDKHGVFVVDLIITRPMCVIDE